MQTIKIEGKKENCPSCKGTVTNYRIKTNDFRCRECACVWEETPERLE